MCARDSNITVGYPYFFLSCIDTLVLVEVVKKKSCIQLHAKCLYKFCVKLSFSFGSSKIWKKME